MLAVPLLNFLVFTIYANFGGILLSFQQFDGYKELFVGLTNYSKFFGGMISEGYLETIGVSFSWLPVVLCVMFPLTVIISFFLYKKVPCAKLTMVFLFIPNIIPMAVMAEFYRRMWDAGGGVVSTGLFNKLFSFVTGREVNWLVSSKYANWALWIYTVWFGFGYYSLLVWGAMSRIPKELIESAQLDGAGLFTEFFKITIPVIWPTLSVVILMYVLTPFSIYMQPLMLAENGKYKTRTLALLAMNELRRPDPYYSAAISIIIACVSLPTAIICKKCLDKAFTVVEI